jgi:hypothetical protein
MDTFDRIEKTVYIAGKVTGLPRWWVVVKFLFWQSYYEMLGYEVKNPVKLVHKSYSYNQAMGLCLELPLVRTKSLNTLLNLS